MLQKYKNYQEDSQFKFDKETGVVKLYLSINFIKFIFLNNSTYLICDVET